MNHTKFVVLQLSNHHLSDRLLLSTSSFNMTSFCDSKQDQMSHFVDLAGFFFLCHLKIASLGLPELYFVAFVLKRQCFNL